ncbi:MAG: MFS transporter [Gemmataceae bacterium]
MANGATHDAYAALRYPGYRRLWGAMISSAIALEMLTVAVGWELYERTGSKAALGYVGLVQFLPVLLLSLPAGHAADRFSRKWQFVGSQFLAAFTTVGLGVLSSWQGPIPLIYVGLTTLGVARAFISPARSALLTQLVPREVLSNAVAWNSGGWQIAATLGPTLGGALIAWLGRVSDVYHIAATLSGISALLVANTTPRPVERATGAHDFAALAAGVKFVWTTRLILATITLDLFAVLLGGAVALLPVYAKDILHVGPTGFGWLRAAPSVGAIIMALALAHRPPLKRAGPTLMLSVAGFGVATIVFGISRNAYLSFAALAISGALDNISIVVRGTLVQLMTPEVMRGRVSAVTTIFIVCSNELGAFESGIAAEWLGTVPSVVIGGIGTLVVVGVVSQIFPELRKLGALMPAEPKSHAQPATMPLGATDLGEARDEATS